MEAAWAFVSGRGAVNKKECGGKTYGFNDIVDEFLGLVDLVFRVGHDEAMQIFFLVTGVSSIRTAFALLDGAFAADRNLCPRLGFHLLQSISTGTDE